MSSATPEPAASSAPDAYVIHARERIAMVREASEITLAVMRALGRHTIAWVEASAAAEPAPAEAPVASPLPEPASAPEPAPAPTAEPAPEPAAAPPERAPVARLAARRFDPALQLDRLARCLCRTTLLEGRLEDALIAYIASEPARRQAALDWSLNPINPDVDPYAPLTTGKKAEVRDRVEAVIDREVADGRQADVLIDALDERLLCDEAYDAIDDLPLRDIVEQLYKDLQLAPDWRRWAGDGWKADPPFSRRRCSPFATPSQRPVLDDDPAAPPPLE